MFKQLISNKKIRLVIYKITAFDLFKRMDGEVNREIVSFLSHSGIPVEQQQPDQIKEGREEKTDMSRMRPIKKKLMQEVMIMLQMKMIISILLINVKQAPVKVGPKVGRNDPCPCGSGKKFKNCHGKDAV